MATVSSKLTHVAVGRPRFLAGCGLEALAPDHVCLSVGLVTAQQLAFSRAGGAKVVVVVVVRPSPTLRQNIV